MKKLGAGKNASDRMRKVVSAKTPTCAEIKTVLKMELLITIINSAPSEAARNAVGGRQTEEQENFLSGLTPEMAERCRNVFTNRVALTANTNKEQSERLRRNGLCEPPVILMLMKVKANAGQKVGTLVALAPGTNHYP